MTTSIPLQEEDRVFMFLDIHSSTALAEQMGNRKYFEFISEFIADSTLSIIETGGEIYQYLGDEIVISWKVNDRQPDIECLHCFFKIKNYIQENADKYETKYGVVPKFKAGIHYGRVAVGEVGTIKRNLIYSGDAMNITAHIQTMCNHLKVDLLVSSEFAYKLKTDQYEMLPIGEVFLKGKKNPVELNIVRDTTSMIIR